MDPLNDVSIETDPRIGALVDGRYQIQAAMASGSMGAVYKAERVPVGKLVAIKFLHASFAKDPEFLTRFERETRVMSKLAHPNCVSVVDFGVWDGAPYLVMEYVAGTTLRSMIDHEPIAPQRALVLARQMSAGLAHAHAQGIVHRDVKPANIMISDEIGTGDHVRILDFGLARLRGNVGRDATQTNVVVGTPNYMAPEQTIGGGTIDARTDIYAVGVVLFEMISGERPYQADDTLALLGMHRAAPIPTLADRIDRSIVLPVGVQALIEKCMAKSPDDRFQTAVELAAAIDEILGPRMSAEHEVVSPRGRERERTDPVAAAPTVRHASEITSPTRMPAAPVGHLVRNAAILVVVLGGLVAAIYFIRIRPSQDAAPVARSTSPVAGTVTDAPPPPSTDGDAGLPAQMVLVLDAGLVDDAGAAADDAQVDVLDAAGEATAATDDAGAVIADEIEMDPEVATNPDPTAEENTAEDEAPDAPATPEEGEKKLPEAPAKAKTVAEAVQMIKDGKRDLALASLHTLYKDSPKSSYIPFLIGNLNFDRLWWGVALEYYAAAIKQNAGYKRNAVLNKNVIKMLGSTSTRRKAQSFLRLKVGKSSLPYLRSAAKTHVNGNVRKQAAALARQI